VIGREHPELALSFNAVRCKLCMVNGKNYGKKFTLRQIHERAIAVCTRVDALRDLLQSARRHHMALEKTLRERPDLTEAC
jgi:hypothetical protein